MFLMEEFEHLKIQLQDVLLATDNFSPSKLIGRGGFGNVYKGEFSFSGGKSIVALKRLDRRFGQGNAEFWKEVMMLSKCKHVNLVSLLHFCFEGDERILVYEYVSRGSLDRHLSDASLTWMQRLKICVGVARGLSYLHDPMETKQRVLHRDVKSSNILLDEEWNAKVSDFGLSKVGPANQPHTYLVSNVVGTFGYCDPLYFETGLLSKESDVYSFGVVLFEVLCGRLCCEYDNGEMICILVPMWRKCFEEDRLDDIIFHDLKEKIQHDSLVTFSTIANRCLQRDHKKRPTMVEIVQELEVAIDQQRIRLKSHRGISERATASFQQPPLLMLENPINCWRAFDQGLSCGTRLPALHSNDHFAYGHKKSFSAGTHLLVCGKDANGHVIWRYELETNKWYKSPPMITPRAYFASATCGNSAFVAGGVTLAEGGTTETAAVVHDTVEKYDPETRSWTPFPRMTKPRKLCSGCYMDDKFYVIGGSNEVEGQLTCGEFFDQQTNKWTLIEGMLNDINIVSLNDAPRSPYIAVLDNELYSIEASSNELKFYQKSTKSWKPLGSVPVRFDYSGHWGVALKSFCNELLVLGASTTTASTSTRSMAIYACTPEPESGRLLEWKLRDYGETELDCLLYNCSVMK